MKAPFKKLVATSVAISLICGFAPPSFADSAAPQYDSNTVSSGVPSLNAYALDTSLNDRGKPGAEQEAAPLLWIGALAIRLSAHALKQAAARGVSHHTIKQVILNGTKRHGNNNTWIYKSGNIQFIVNKTTGKIVTVTKGRA